MIVSWVRVCGFVAACALLAGCAGGQFSSSDSLSKDPSQALLVYGVNASAFEKQSVSFRWRQFDPDTGALNGPFRDVSTRRDAGEILGSFLVGRAAYNKHDKNAFHVVAVPAGSYLLQSITRRHGNTTRHSTINQGTVAVDAKAGEVLYLGNIEVGPGRIRHSGGQLEAASAYLEEFDGISVPPAPANVRVGSFSCVDKNGVSSVRTTGRCVSGKSKFEIATARAAAAVGTSPVLDNTPFRPVGGVGHVLLALNVEDYEGQELTAVWRQINPNNRRPVSGVIRISEKDAAKAGATLRMTDPRNGEKTYFLARLPAGQYVLQGVGGKNVANGDVVTHFFSKRSVEFSVEADRVSYAGAYKAGFQLSSKDETKKHYRTVGLGDGFDFAGHDLASAADALKGFGVDPATLVEKPYLEGSLVCLRKNNPFAGGKNIMIEETLCLSE